MFLHFCEMLFLQLSSSDESDLRSDLSSEMSSILSDNTQTVPESSATQILESAVMNSVQHLSLAQTQPDVL